MYHLYMISRAFIPPWSLAMRDRKLSDQTLPVKAVGTLVSPSIRFYDPVTEKSRTFPTRKLENYSAGTWLFSSDFSNIRMIQNRNMEVLG